MYDVLLFDWQNKQKTKSNNNNKRYGQVCLIRQRFERFFSLLQLDNGRSNSLNVASLNILVHDMINLLYYEQ